MAIQREQNKQQITILSNIEPDVIDTKNPISVTTVAQLKLKLSEVANRALHDSSKSQQLAINLMNDANIQEFGDIGDASLLVEYNAGTLLDAIIVTYKNQNTQAIPEKVEQAIHSVFGKIPIKIDL